MSLRLMEVYLLLFPFLSVAQCFSADVTYSTHNLQVTGKRCDSDIADSALACPGFPDNSVFF